MAKTISGQTNKSKAQDLAQALVGRQMPVPSINSLVVVSAGSAIADRGQETGCDTFSN
jgi:hypothetical protein